MRIPARRLQPVHARRTLCASGIALLAIASMSVGVGCASGGGDARAETADTPRPAQAQRSSRSEAEQLLESAELLVNEDRDEEAIRLLAMAIERNPELTVAHMAVGDIYRENGDFDAAANAYGDAARLEPRSFDANYRHGLMLHLLDRLTDAVRAYLRAIAVRPDDVEANLNLATAYLQLDEPTQALPYARRTIRLDPGNGAGRANLGAVLSALDRHAEAVEQYEAALELLDLSPDLLLNLAESQGKIGRYREMVNTLNSAVSLSESADAYERLGFAHFRLREYSPAEQAFRRSIELDPGYYPALNGLGVCLLNDYLFNGRKDRGVRDESMEMFRRSLRINRAQPRITDLISRYSRA